MNTTRTITLLLCVLLTLVTQAQKRKTTKRTTAPKKEVVVEKTAGELLYEEMLPSTAKVMFVDSIVTDKDSFMKHIIIDKEAGQLTANGELISYTNEFGTQRYLSAGDTLKGYNLLTTQLIGEQWSTPTPTLPRDNGCRNPRNPFMLSDGTTLFFAAEGEKSIGGYDIFTTTYNDNTATFYEPNNYGLPFNSKYNEYLLAIDEFNNLGWLVSDRYQDSGKVCIYIFEPTLMRQSYENDNLTDAQLKSLADIAAISDTWKIGNMRAAEARIKQLATKAVEKEDVAEFIINDDKTYKSASEFKSESARRKYSQLKEMNEMLSMNRKSIDEMRKSYRDADAQQRSKIKSRILSTQETIEQLEKDIAATAKDIRKLETQ